VKKISTKNKNEVKANKTLVIKSDNIPTVITSTYCPYIIPNEFNEMNEFIVKNKLVMTEKVASAVEYALDNDLNAIEVFKFKNSDFIITLHKPSFLENINHIYNYYIEIEQYELCPRIKSIQSKLKLMSILPTSQSIGSNNNK